MNAQQFLAHYERIADATDAIARLRRFVLDLAVRGKLVPQASSDNSVLELVDRIAREKQSATKNSLPAELPAQPSETPFQVPKSWIWVPATYPALIVSDLESKVQTRDVLATGSYPVVDQGKAFIRGYCNDASKVIKVESPIIVFGDHTREIKLIDFDFIVGADGVKLLRPICLDPDFYRLALEWLPIRSRGYGRHFKILKASFVPLPPLAEQHRIVAKVEELMALCDQLEAARTEREATRDRLTAAGLARLNAPNPETLATDAHLVLDALHSITARADQIKQLRQAILNLAVRGKLVQQIGGDGFAAELLERISAERQELIARKLLRQERPLSPIKAKEPPFPVPESWCWSRIGEAVLFAQYGTSQKAFPASDGVPVLAMGNIQKGRVVWGNEKRISQTSSELPDLYLKKYDLLYNRTNSAELVGKTGIYLGDDDELTFASYLIRLRPSIKWTSPHYLNVWMNTSLFRSTQIIPHIKKQTGQANVNGTALKNMLVPLPPLDEQRRIVAKVEELMTLCDQLEASLASADDARGRLLDALLAEALQPALQAAA